MEFDTNRVRELLDKRDELDQELQTIFNAPQKKLIKCGTCGEDGHSARTCPKKQP